MSPASSPTRAGASGCLPATNVGDPSDVATDRMAATAAVTRADSHGRPRTLSTVYTAPTPTPSVAMNV